MGTLDETVALIVGGAGDVGEGIVAAFLREGATVVVPSRSDGKLARLREAHGAAAGGRLVTQVARVGEEEDADRLRDEIQGRFGRLDAVVASLGGWWQGAPLVDVPLETWQRVLSDNLTAHFVAARAFLPAVAARGGSYTLIAGPAGAQPVPFAGPVSVAVAGQLMLKKVLVEEGRHAGSPARINDLIIGNVITRANAATRGPDGFTAVEVGAVAARLASDAGRPFAGETFHLPDRAALAAALERLARP